MTHDEDSQYETYAAIVSVLRTSLEGGPVPKREKSKRLQVVITEEQDSLLTKTAYQLSNPERLVSKSEVVRLGIEMLNRAVEDGSLDPEMLKAIEGA